MTPKEKAIELMCNLDGSKYFANYCINEILESFNPLEYYPEDLRDYWNKVKEEIEKLQPA